MARVLIAGYGALGRKLTPLLAAAGHQVLGINRSGSVEPPAQAVQADLLNAASLSPIPAFDYLIYTATPSHRAPEAYRDAYLIGLQTLLQTLEHPIAHIFFVSSTSVYHQSAGEWVDELSETKPTQFSGQIILEAENFLRESGKPHTCVRFGGIYGNGRLALLRNVEAGQPVVKNPPVYTNRIHEEDCAGVLAFLIERHLAGAELKKTYLAVDDVPADEWTIKQWLAQEMGLPAVPEQMPVDPVNQNKRCSNAQLKALGYQFIYPGFQQGYMSIWQALL